MKSVFLLLTALAFAAVLASDQESSSNSLRREERSAIPDAGIRQSAGGRRERKSGKARKPKSKGQRKKKKARKNQNNKKRRVNKAKRGGKRDKGKKSTKVKKGKRQRQSRQCDVSGRLQQINSWRSGIKNFQNLYSQMTKKVDNGTVKSALLEYFNASMEAIGKVTKDGTECILPCNQSACDAYKTLSNCSASSLESCSGYPASNTTEEEDCNKLLDKLEETCNNDTKACCAIDFKQYENCKYSTKVRDMRAVYKQCINNKEEGTLGNCMLLVKQTTGLINDCLDGDCNTTSPCPSIVPNTTCINDCYKAAESCIEGCSLKPETCGNCTYPTPTLINGECCCKPEDCRNGDYCDRTNGSCECKPKCTMNDQCPGFNATCNDGCTDTGSCEYCGNCADFGCCKGCASDANCAYPKPDCQIVIANNSIRNFRTVEPVHQCGCNSDESCSQVNAGDFCNKTSNCCEEIPDQCQSNIECNDLFNVSGICTGNVAASNQTQCYFCDKSGLYNQCKPGCQHDGNVGDVPRCPETEFSKCDLDTNKCIQPTPPGSKLLRAVQFCSSGCVGCTTEGVKLEMTGRRPQNFQTSCTLDNSTSGTDFSAGTSEFTGEENGFNSCYREPLDGETSSLKVTWEGTGTWYPSKICLSWTIDSDWPAWSCNFTYGTALTKGEYAEIIADGTNCDWTGSKTCDLSCPSTLPTTSSPTTSTTAPAGRKHLLKKHF